MPITGSVQKTSLSVAATTVTLPANALTIVGLQFNGPLLSIPIDPTRSAFFVNAGGTTKVNSKTHLVQFVVSGTTLNFQTYYSATTSATFYYGSAAEGQLALTSFAAVHQAATLVAGTATATVTFPSGPLTMVGIIGVDTTAAADVTLNFNTSAGQSLTAYFPNQILANEILPILLPVSQTLSVTYTGTGTDVLEAIIYYQ